MRLDDKKAKGRDPMWGSILRLAVYGILFAALLTGCTRREETGGTEPVTEETTQRPSEETEEKPTEPIEEIIEPFPEEEVKEEPPGLKIIIATDMHYLARELTDMGSGFVDMVEHGDGKVTNYIWQIMDAFTEEVIQEKPDLLLLTGDLSLDGELRSHMEFAGYLEKIEGEGIPVAVIPGNHDINNAGASRFYDGKKAPAETTSPEQFYEIYRDYGYDEAVSRDSESLSYVYPISDRVWGLMLDSCQYKNGRLTGGMIDTETYSWIEEQLDAAYEENVMILPLSHHNLLDQSQIYQDDCTIEHSEQLTELFVGWGVPLHLSGHLHIQHYREESGVSEVVTGSLLMEPFQYGVIDILRNGDIHYYSRQVDVEGWAKGRGMKNPELLDFESYARHYMWEVNWEKAYRELSAKVQSGDVYLTGDEVYRMALYYAAVCENYYAGTMYKVIGEAKADPAYELWMDIEFTTETSSFLDNILQDPALNYTDILMKY